jgi:pimeloyl-ACP methyl ester carboxylesterase
MAYLANAGFDVFAMDFSGYGRSTRPPAMNDPCNLSPEQQTSLDANRAACPAAYSQQATTIASDWDDLNAVVDYIRTLRRVERVHLIGWSLGGPRAGGFTVRHPAKVQSLVLLAPAFNRTAASSPPPKVPADGVAFNKQSRADFDANWSRQVGCPAQVDPAAADAVWSAMLESDPVGATWGPGVRRAPGTTTWGFNAEAAAKIQVPALIVAGAHDKQVTPDRVRELYTALGSKQKTFVDLGCASHNAMWESNRLLLFRASLEWLTTQSVTGAKDGVVRLGYDATH